MICTPTLIVHSKQSVHVHLFIEKISLGHVSPRLVGVDAEVGFRGIGWQRQPGIDVHFDDLVPQIAETLFHERFETAPSASRGRNGVKSS